MVCLRPYQATAVAHTVAAIRAGKHPVLSLPTGAGKSLCAAALTQTMAGRVLVATHRQELLVQNANQLLRLNPEESVGIYSAGLGRRDISQRVMFGGIQSIYERMDALQVWGAFQAVIVDEAHRVSPRNVPNVMYARLFGALNGAPRIGMSATPYRLDSGLLYEGEEAWFDHLAVDMGIRQLTPAYLAPLRGLLTAANVPTEGVHVRAGEFVTGELSQRACEEAVVQAAVDEIMTLAANRRKWLVFCVDKTHTTLVCATLRARGCAAEMILGETPQDARHAILDDFRQHDSPLRALCNCQVFTEGFDVPDVDCVVLLRPTMSRALLVQMVGRGCRHAPGKEDCLILDLAGNLERHAPLDALVSEEDSPARAEAKVKAQAQAHRTRERDARHATQASTADPWMRHEDLRTYAVSRVYYRVVPSRNPRYAGKSMLQVSYCCPERPGAHWVSQFVCCEYPGWAGEQAAAWFKRRGFPGLVPNAERAASLRRRYPAPDAITVAEAGKWPQVVIEHFPGASAWEGDGYA